MSLPKAYEPSQYEADIYALWEKSGAFKANPTSDKPHFSIAMPPPNETGSLHIGQALGVALQDLMARRARQQGCDVLLLHGTDHAALPVNLQMVKKLAEEGTTKEQIGREEFLKRTREHVGTSRDSINKQIKVMGASVDWSRLRYTLDETLNRCVNEVFVKMYNDGLIYRGSRIVNWDPKLATTVSDDELIHQEEKTPLYTLQFGPFQIATSRPETKFGDKYVVVHPDDDRYKAYKQGQEIEVEWLNGKLKATVIKDEVIVPEFGTGAMTITPWHDRTDFEIAERHGLEKVQVIDHEGKLLPIAGQFAGQHITEARPKIIKMLQEKGLVVEINEDYVHAIALNSRGKGVIEPQIMLQWFVDVNRPAVEWKGQKRSLKEVMRAVIDDGDIKLHPERFERLYFHWIDNLRDWCISRQIWWGHQIPVWYKQKGDEIYVGVQPPGGDGWQQDPDTLDTWFSSALWTWSTLVDQDLAKDFKLNLGELLKSSQDFQTYHPTSVMETGWDILFFWVARMILATTYATGQLPFKDVYLHGLVRTPSGKKMSKSDPESNIDPLTVIDEFGTDALRLALVAGATAGNDQKLGRGDIIAGRNFANKLWNIARFTENVGVITDEKVAPKTLADHWILNKLSIFSKALQDDLDKFRLSSAHDQIYHFVWDDFADWYVEASKSEPNPSVLSKVLRDVLILTHPFAPFVTESLWQQLKFGDLCSSQLLPELATADSQKAKQFEVIKNLVTELRRINTALGLSKPRLFYDGDGKELVASLAGLGDVEALGKPTGLKLSSAEAWLDIDSQTAQKYLAKLDEQRQAAQMNAKRLKIRLQDKHYLDKAPEELVAETKQQLEATEAEARNLATELAKYQKSLN